MITSQRNKKGEIQKPWMIQKKRKSPIKVFYLFLYSHEVIVDNEVRFKYRMLRYGGVPAEFKTREIAKQTAQYLLGMNYTETPKLPEIVFM